MPPEPRTDEQLRLLADSFNRTLLAVLEDADGALHVETAAERLVRHEEALVDPAEYEDQLERTIITLHHNRLPKLASAGLLEYDRETNTVAYREPPSLDTEWLATPDFDEVLGHLAPSDGDGRAGIRVIEGRESVIEFGRQLADEAEEELFCMYVSTDLLEEECVRRGRKAIERGVTMYLGSQNSAVRQLTREHLPEAVIWEPQLDWMNTPTYPRVGRLVLIDRRKVMLAILDEPGPDDAFPDERATVGEGVDNPLVVLVRELLGSRLDHLDYQSENFRSEYVA